MSEGTRDGEREREWSMMTRRWVGRLDKGDRSVGEGEGDGLNKEGMSQNVD